MSKYFNNENILQMNYINFNNKINSENYEFIKNHCLNKTNAETKHFEEFMNDLFHENYKNIFKLFLENVNDYDFYRIILSSTHLFSRIKKLNEPEDQFFYLILASEIGYYNKKDKNLSKSKKFRDFYIKYLSRKNKIILVSTFRNKHINRYVNENDLNEYKLNNKKRPKETKFNTYVPNCYKKKQCRFSQDFCIEYEPYCCPLTNQYLNDKLIDILNYYYNKRSDFVHAGISFGLYDFSIDTYIRNNECKNVLINLSLKNFLECYQEALINQIKDIMDF